MIFNKTEKLKPQNGGPSAFSFNNNILSSYDVRYENFNGREHIAVPAAVLMGGVHSGSSGSLFYNSAEVAKFPEAWNGVPVPINHPQDASGSFCSCNSPSIIEEYSVGRFWNCFFDGKLRGEIWCDTSKLAQKSPSTLAKLKKGLPIEVSTSFFSDIEPISGTWNGESFDGEVVNIRPDHVAILPESVGACSVDDGCGIRANLNRTGVKVPAEVCRALELLGVPKHAAAGLYRKFMFNAAGLGDEMSHSDLRVRFYEYLKDKFPGRDSLFIPDVFDSYFIVEDEAPLDDGTYGPKYYMVPYTAAGGTVSITGEPSEVNYVERYIPVGTKEVSDSGEGGLEVPGPVQSGDTNTEGGTAMAEKKNGTANAAGKDGTAVTVPADASNAAGGCVKCAEAADELIANGLGFSADDKDFLYGLPLKTLEGLLDVENRKKKTDQTTPPISPKSNTAKETITMESLPEEVRSLIRHAGAAEARQRNNLIRGILSNTRNRLQESELKEMTTSALCNMAELGGASANYLGAGGSILPDEAPGVDPLPDVNPFSAVGTDAVK